MKGAPPGRTGGPAVTLPVCPGCAGLLAPVRGALVPASRCAGCQGLWIERATFERLFAAPPDRASSAPPGVRWARRCPFCGATLARIRPGRVRGVTVDACRSHGAFFDARELARIRSVLVGGPAGRCPPPGALADLVERELLLARRAAAERGGPGAADPLDLLATLLP